MAAPAGAAADAVELPLYNDQGPYKRALIPAIMRPVGDLRKSKPPVYPKFEEYPPHVQAVLKRRGDKPVRIFMDGIFDLTHYGHFRALQQAKLALPNVTLVAGVNSDADTHRYKGITLMSGAERAEGMVHCRWVDEIVMDSPWVIGDDFLAAHDIDLVAHDALPYNDLSGATASGDVYLHLREAGKFYETARTEGVSTTDLIMRVISRYDAYVARNLARGMTMEEMGVPRAIGAVEHMLQERRSSTGGSDGGSPTAAAAAAAGGAAAGGAHS